MGCLDDFIDLHHHLKLFFEILLCAVFVFFNEFYINNCLNLESYVVCTLFTIIFIVALINSINMLDGMDGLVGGLIVIIFFSFYIISVAEYLHKNILLIYLFGGALTCFLLFNLRFPWQCKALVFLGDAGSIMLGFVLGWFSISLSYKTDFVNILWVLALPLWDMVRVIFVRLLSGKHPMKADRQHLHHLLQAKGFSVSQTLFIILSIVIFSSSVGIGGWFYEISTLLMLSIFIIMFVIYFYTISFLMKNL